MNELTPADPSPLRIPSALHRRMVEHCRSEAPLEACGLLIGRPHEIRTIEPLRNQLASATRYQADASDLIAAIRRMRNCGDAIVAIYHSHPSSPAVPSRTDLLENHYGDVPRIIVSLLAEPPAVLAWTLTADSYREVPIEVGPDVESGPGRRYTLRTILPRYPWSRSMQRTLVLFKPDCVQRRLVGPILARFEAKGLRIDGLKLVQVGRELAEKHYDEHKARPFFGGLIEFITAGPVVAAVLSGPDAVPLVRKLMGKTHGAEAEPGTIRGDYSLDKQNNLVHGSDSLDSATREIALWFRPEELADYPLVGQEWVASP